MSRGARSQVQGWVCIESSPSKNEQCPPHCEKELSLLQWQLGLN